MKTVGVAEFKEQCLELLDQLDIHGLIITKHGKPVAMVMPYEQKITDFQLAVLNGSLRDKVTIKGDIFSTGIRWDAES
jgi:prevent-host-death family protein